MFISDEAGLYVCILIRLSSVQIGSAQPRIVGLHWPLSASLSSGFIFLDISAYVRECALHGTILCSLEA